MNSKIVILATDGISTKIIYNKLSVHYDIQHVIIEDRISKKIFIKNRLKKLGVLKVMGQLLFQAIVLPIIKQLSKNRKKEIFDSIGPLIKDIPEEKIIRICSVNHDLTRQKLSELSPDLVIVNGTRVIGKKTLSILTAPFINTHVGITPCYRGVHGGYWALVNKQPHLCGVTVHLVDTGVDTGSILAQGTITPQKNDCFATYPIIQTIKGAELLLKVVPDVLAKKIIVVESLDGTQSMQYYHPTAWEYVYNYVFKSVK